MPSEEKLKERAQRYGRTFGGLESFEVFEEKIIKLLFMDRPFSLLVCIYFEEKG